MIFAHKIGEINQTILLSLIFIVGFGLYNIFYRIFKVFAFFFKKEKISTWQDFEENQKSLADAEKMF